MHGLKVRNGSTLENGGGLRATMDTGVALSSMSFEENGANNGGAIENAGSMRIYGSTFDQNGATTAGAIFNLATLNILNSTFIRNQAVGGFAPEGGAIFHTVSGEMNVDNSTFCLNHAQLSGGGIYNVSTIPNLLGNLLADNTDSNIGPDLRDGGTIAAASKNVVESALGHTLDPTVNKIGMPQTCNPGDNGGPTTTTTPPQPGTPAHDSGANREGLRYDQRGGLRNRGLSPDAGATESGNLFFQGDSGDWFDPNNWSSLSIPGSIDAAWIRGGETVNLSAGAPPPAAGIDVLGVGAGGGVNAAGTLVGTGVDLNATQIAVGSADPDHGVYSAGTGTFNVSGVQVQADFLEIGQAGASLEDMEAEADGDATLDGGASTTQVSETTSVGVATVFAGRSTATARGSLNITGASADLGNLQAGSAFSDGNAQTGAQVDRAYVESSLSGPFLSRLSTFGQAFSAGGQANVRMVQGHFNAANFIADNVFIAGVQTSAAPGEAMPEATVGEVDFSVDASAVSIANGLTISNISASGSGPAQGDIGQVDATITADMVDVNNLTLGAVFAASAVNARVGHSSLTITANDVNLMNSTNVGTLTLSNGASGVIEHARLNAQGGTFSSAGGFAPDLNIATVSVFTPAAEAKTTATVTFTDGVASFERNVNIATTNSAGASPDSYANGTLELNNHQLSAGGNVTVAVDTGVAPISLGVGRIELNPSFLDVEGDLILGDRAVLQLGIEGLPRPIPGTPGAYSAIDAANGALDGHLVLAFDFPVVQLGDTFDLIRLDGGGTFTGLFDRTDVTGLPPGLAAETQIIAQSLVATIVEAGPGDFNGDGNVDGFDFLEWQRGFGGAYDANDLADWETNYGNVSGPITAARN